MCGLHDHSVAKSRQVEGKMKVFQPLSTAVVMTCLFSVHIQTNFLPQVEERSADLLLLLRTLADIAVAEQRFLKKSPALFFLEAVVLELAAFLNPRLTNLQQSHLPRDNFTCCNQKIGWKILQRPFLN